MSQCEREFHYFGADDDTFGSEQLWWRFIHIIFFFLLFKFKGQRLNLGYFTLVVGQNNDQSTNDLSETAGMSV